MKIVVANKIPLLEKQAGDESRKVDDEDFFITTLVLPHVTTFLIREDYSCGRKDAFHIARISEAFGAREYPLSAECPALDRLRKGEAPMGS